MNKNEAFREIENNGLIIISIAAVLIYWFFDSLLSGIVFVRLLIASLIVTYGTFTQYLINSHKIIQKELKSAHNDLEEQVKTRTAALVAANEELRKSERLFQTLARVSPVGIFRADARGDFVYVNDRWCEIAGMPIEKALGRSWADAIHPDERKSVVSKWYGSVQGSDSFSLEYRFHRRDGNSTWVLGQATAEVNDAGEVSGYVGTITDITERKRADRELTRQTEMLQAIFDHIPVMIQFSDPDGTHDDRF